MIKKTLQNDQLHALKSKNKEKLVFLRYILAQIKNREIEKKLPTGTDLSDEETIAVLKKIEKQLRESIAAFEKGGRQDLVKEYANQLTIVSSYLPKEISDEELICAIKELVEKNKQLYQTKPKAIIGICIKELKSKADPSRILKILQSLSPN